MRIEGERRFDAKPEDVYDALTDPDRLCEAFAVIERIDGDRNDWTVIVRPPFPGGFRLRFSVQLDDLREHEHARLRAWGKSLGGRVSVDTTFDLAPAGEGSLMHWVADVDAAGLFSGLGSQSLGVVAKRHADRALGRLAKNLERAPAT